MSTAAQYPARDSHFAHRFVRLLAKCNVATEIGPEATWLLTVIAHTEDATHYTKPVAFFNEQLMGYCGFNSKGRLIRSRDRAANAGWLHYQPGVRRRPATYWCLIPRGLEKLPDDFGDVTSDCQGLGFQNGTETAGPIGSKIELKGDFGSKIELQTNLKRTSNGTPSTLTLLNTSPGKIPDEQISGRKEKPEPRFTPEDFAVAKEIWFRLNVLQPHRKQPNLNEWAGTIRLMRERDIDRGHAKVLELFERVQQDPFWKKNILSPDKLREKWDQLVLKLMPARPAKAAASEQLQPVPGLKGIGA